MEWSFDCRNGAVTVRQEGQRAICQAIRPADNSGLYKAWLRGGEGRALLGTLIPEGGALRLHRGVEIGQLERQGAWPPVGAEIELAFRFAPEAPPPQGWSWSQRPGKLLGDPVLARALRDVKRGLIKRDLEGFFLALPYSPREPFPMPPLFCLSQLERLSGQWYVLFRFSRQGCPELLHNFSEEGKDRGGT